MPSADLQTNGVYKEPPRGFIRQSLSDIRLILVTIILSATTLCLEAYEYLGYKL